MGEWIACVDQLPEKNDVCLVVIQNYIYKKNTRLEPFARSLRIMTYDGDEFEDPYPSPLGISVATYWMLLPDLPKEGG